MITNRAARLVLAVAVAAAGLAACSGGDPGTPTPSSSTTGPGSPAPTEEPSPTPTATATPVDVAVYYLVDTRAGIRLARETHEATGDDPVRAAVEQMIAGPTDPDYSTAWDPGTQVLGVTRSSGTLTVDLSEEARTASIGSEGAATMVQQLVFTATAAEGDEAAGVLLTIAGEPAGELWGAVTWDAPVTRVDPLTVRQLVQIAVPAEGATSSSPVEVSGDAAAFEANVPWRVLDAAGTEVTTGFATTSEGQVFAPFSFTVELAPGTYTIEISEDDPSGGAGGTPMTDTRTVTVS
jgi:spore germination protein GerM